MWTNWLTRPLRPGNLDRVSRQTDQERE